MTDANEALRRLGHIQCPACGTQFNDETSPHGVETRVASQWKNEPTRPKTVFSINGGCSAGPPASPWVRHATCSAECARLWLWKLVHEHDIPGAEYQIVAPA